MLLSPIDKAFLTNIFDDVEAVADCFGAISIAQPKSNKMGNNGHINSWFILLFKCTFFNKQNCLSKTALNLSSYITLHYMMET